MQRLPAAPAAMLLEQVQEVGFGARLDCVTIRVMVEWHLSALRWYGSLLDDSLDRILADSHSTAHVDVLYLSRPNPEAHGSGLQA
jgi:hypothetical protein